MRTFNLGRNALLLCGMLSVSSVFAQDEDAIAAMAKKAQDPLADVKAIMTDNTIAFGGGNDDDTSYGFQI